MILIIDNDAAYQVPTKWQQNQEAEHPDTTI